MDFKEFAVATATVVVGGIIVWGIVLLCEKLKDKKDESASQDQIPMKVAA